MNEIIFSKISNLSFSNIYFSSSLTSDSTPKSTDQSLSKFPSGWSRYADPEAVVRNVVQNIRALKSFAKLTRKHLRRSLIFKGVGFQLSVCNFIKKDTLAQTLSVNLSQVECSSENIQHFENKINH